ncbi:hypothetical protein KY308_02160 [Candidatus Woesearchaeota archaeon]|nr:hypothetical protein [Candidatus Woesearchaeota archaeon]
MLKILKHKRGMNEVYKVIIELFIALMVMIAVISYSVNVGTAVRIFKEKTARDVALTIETIQASPGAVLFSYADVRGFVYGFDSNRINVYTQDEDQTLNSNTFYFFPKDLDFTFSIPKEKIRPEIGASRTVLSYRKNYPIFDINSQDLSLDAITCQKINVSSDVKAFIVYSEKSLIESSEAESYRQKIESKLLPLLRAVAPSQNVFFVTGKDQLLTASQNNPQAIVLEVSDVYNEYINAEFFISADKKAQRFACLSKNLLNKENLESVIHGESFEDIQNPIILKIQANRADFEKTMEILGKAANEYFK